MNTFQSLLLCSIFSLSSALPAYEARELKRGLSLQRLNKQSIEEHKLAIGKRIQRARLVKWGILGTSIAIVASYKWATRNKKEEPILDITEASADRDIAYAGAKASIRSAKNTKDLPNFEGTAWWVYCLFDWKLIPATGTAYVFSLGLNHGLPPVLKFLGLDEEAQGYKIPSNYDAITSFSQKVLQIQKLENALDYYAERLSKPGIAPHQKDYYEKGLISLCNGMKDKLEMLLGYMLYKIDGHQDSAGYTEALGIIEFITEEASDFCVFLEETINNNEKYTTQNECKELHEAIRTFCQSLEQEIGHFAILDL